VYGIANLSHHNFVYLKKSEFLRLAVERICKYLNIKPKLQGVI